MNDNNKIESGTNRGGDFAENPASAGGAPTKPKRQNGRETHALYTVAGTLKAADLARKKLFAKNTNAGRYRAACYQAYVEMLGGEAKASPKQLRLIKITVVEEAMLDKIDGYLLEPKTKLITRRKRDLAPIFMKRQALVDSLTRHLNMLGLSTEQLPAAADLDAYLTGKSAKS